LEVVAFGLGIACVMIEIFVVPGMGVFGIGGLLLIVAGIILTSQTFVIPRNPYQYAQMTRSLGNVLIACGGLAGGFLILRWLLPSTPIFRHIRLDLTDLAMIEQREQIAHYDHLLGAVGRSVTSLRPSGKARFGSELVAVVSDGSPIAEGEPVRVLEVHGNRIVVESTESS
jgi:membrane-bound ClpP family serine protease